MERKLSDGAPTHVVPNDTVRRLINVIVAPHRIWFDPRFYGTSNVPETGAVMLAGNHNLLGSIDAPLIFAEVLNKRGRLIRGLAEHVLVDTPGVRELLHRIGSVRGTRNNCRTLLENGEAVIVFPGGGREACRRKDEKYALLWDQRTGFARMALEAGCPIVPVAAIGPDDALDIVIDADHAIFKPLKALTDRIGFRWEIAPPVVKGIGPTPIPRPERFYFSFGTPIDTTPWADATDMDAAAAEVRDLVRKTVEEDIRFLLAEQARDRGRTLWGRLFG